MTCPICDQKPMNCDCTETERRQFSEIEDLEAEIDRLRARPCPYVTGTVTHYCTLTPFTLSDAEREAVEAAAKIIDAYEEEMDGFPSGAAATLRGLLERTRATGSVKGLAAIRAAEQDAEITPEIAAALEGERNRATVKPKALPPRAS